MKSNKQKLVEGVIDAKFVKYFNDFYGPNGLYPTKGQTKPITKQEIEKGYDAVLKHDAKMGSYKHEFEGDSIDRELIRDMMIKLNIIDPDYTQKESKMKSNKQKLVENKLRQLVKEILNEEGGVALDSQDVKAANMIVQALSQIAGVNHMTNDKKLKSIDDTLSGIRIDVMEYVEANSPYKYASKGGNGWKLVKK